MNNLSLGYSPCPNDTFIFYALIHGRLPGCPFSFEERLEDVETLNRLAAEAVLDLSKVSYHALGHLRQDYALLHSGGALGRGCGPLVVAKNACALKDLKGKTIAIPGQRTTANLLLQLYDEGLDRIEIMPFHTIMSAVAQERVAAGVIIHESRFTYPQHGLELVQDLGQWWEETTGHPIPLGGILAKRSLGEETIRQIDRLLQQSVDYAFVHPQEPRGYIKQHSQELTDEVIESHIQLYVNDFSRHLGEEGRAAVEYLLQRAEDRGLIPPSDLPLFLS